MNRFVVLLTLLAALAVPSAASALSYTAPAPLPKSPPDAGTKSLAGPEPSLTFDLLDGKHVYVAAPGSPEDDANGGINFWASADGGQTWPIAKNIGSLAGGGDAEVETLIDHTVLTADLEVVSSAICHSKDYGKTFSDNCEAGGLASDHQGPESDREWLTHDAKDKNVVYLTYHDFAGQMPIIERSDDQAASFAPCGTLLDPAGPAFASYTPVGGTDVGKPAIASDGTLAVPITEPSTPDPTGGYDGFYVAVAKGCQNGTVFANSKVYQHAGANLANIFSYVAWGSDGTLYALTAGTLTADQKTSDVYLWTSKDRGKTWSKPHQVNSPDLKANEIPAIATGPTAGQVLVGWYGTKTSGDATNDSDQWGYYVAQSADGGKTFDTTALGDGKIYHHGAICTLGILCTSGRNLADFSSVAVNPRTGCGATVFPADPYNTDPNASDLKDPAAFFARQANCPGSGSGGSGSGGSGSGGSGNSCHDRLAPRSALTRVHITGRLIDVRGTSRDRGCNGRLRSVRVGVARLVTPTRCRFLRANGKLGRTEPCRRSRTLTPRGRARWSVVRHGRYPHGRWRAWVRATDAAGNRERRAPSAKNARTVFIR